MLLTKARHQYHVALLVRGFSTAWLGSGMALACVLGARTDGASPSLCRSGSLCAIVEMNQVTDTDLFKVGQQPPNQLCVPKTFAAPQHHHSSLQLKLACVKDLL